MRTKIFHGVIAMKFYAESVGEALQNIKDNRKESAKWSAVFAAFILPCMGAMAMVNSAVKRYDILGGRSTVSKYLNSNAVGLLVVCVAAIAYIIVMFKTFKGRKSSIYQLLLMVAAGFLIIYSGFGFTRAFYNIKDDLNNITETKLDEYVLCTLQSDSKTSYYTAFEDKGECVLLMIPQKKYNELSLAAKAENPDANEAYRLVADSQYTTYQNAEVYRSPITVKYYFNSVIYEDCEVNSPS